MFIPIQSDIALQVQVFNSSKVVRQVFFVFLKKKTTILNKKIPTLQKPLQFATVHIDVLHELDVMNIHIIFWAHRQLLQPATEKLSFTWLDVKWSLRTDQINIVYLNNEHGSLINSFKLYSIFILGVVSKTLSRQGEKRYRSSRDVFSGYSIPQFLPGQKKKSNHEYVLQKVLTPGEPCSSVIELEHHMQRRQFSTQLTPVQPRSLREFKGNSNWGWGGVKRSNEVCRRKL